LPTFLEISRFTAFDTQIQIRFFFFTVIKMKFSIATIAFLAATVLASPAPPFDPNGAKNVGNGAGGQFIGGQCKSNADCGSGCCANPTGICSGPGAANQAGKTGCGFGGAAGGAAASPSADAGVQEAAATPSPAAGAQGASPSPANGGPAFDPNGAKNVGNGKAGQFIGGQCLSGADCGSGCCAGPSGICSGPGASTQNGKTGCGFASQQKKMMF
jgi:hypothetical protein